MVDEHDCIVIPIISSGELFKASDSGPVRGGGTRYVPLIRTPHGPWPCIFKSHKIISEVVRDGCGPVPCHECILLVSRDPLQTIRAVIEVEGFKTFDMVPVEW